MDQVGLVPVGCNIHDWMLSYIVVVDSPWFGTTGSAGRVTLTELPAGKYQLSAWHPRIRQAEEREIEIVKEGMQEVGLELRLRPDRRIRRAPTGSASQY
jgi:hypothetical protein